ncbi:hypothetical protein [Flavilitoribacter nigricans]|uniref:Uncharacterized protein n=1 Tax=Flavilitoribacter nigricans (strain ATCC 23147 / DSM 23189 / NBRC 102662 / NCIMB 1420 / SS-2) TaxID=1122177 RepID=A0A2D0MZJ0_FLAN2|nr:hypothetical protein [Flavilitoribacter nigricans]PHN00863.1 hypothetical protein CRP01_39945 [Flavilitoribacter nigricans DSM 23189 = NBRC 102662]
MIFFGEKVKAENKVAVLILLGLSISWRYWLGPLDFIAKDQYISPTIGFFLGMILIGELTRKVFRLIIKRRIRRDYAGVPLPVQPKDQEDQVALLFGIGWAIFFNLQVYL